MIPVPTGTDVPHFKRSADIGTGRLNRLIAWYDGSLLT